MEEFIFVFELIGTAAFAFSGASIAIKCEMDLLGIIILGIFTAVGGGVIRDILLGSLPPRIFFDPVYVFVAAAVSLIVFFLKRTEPDKSYWKSGADRSRKTFYAACRSIFAKAGVEVCDAIGLAVFTIIGVEAGYTGYNGCNMFLAVFVGVMTGVGGGMLRDVLSGLKPYIFVKDIYALSSLSGAFIYAVFRGLIGNRSAMFLGMSAIFILRILSMKWKWNLPKAAKSI